MNQPKPTLKVSLIKMNDMEFDDSLFIPMKTNTLADQILSTEGGLFPGTNTIVIGDPGVGKSTVLLDWIANLQRQDKRVLFVSGEMNEIDMYGYTKRYPKFGELPILFLANYSNTQLVIEKVFEEGYHCIMIDSWAEVVGAVKEENDWSKGQTEKWLLTLMDQHNKAHNKQNIHTAFLCIQQMTKGGEFAGSNRIKHMTTAMIELRFEGSGVEALRFMEYSKNRRGGLTEPIYFSLTRGEVVDYSFEVVN
jgi:DNA repair protein RadA/Sms